MQLSRAAVIGLVALVCSTVARADVPPEDGSKYVGNTFRVTGLAKFPDYLIVAFPWSASNGAPTREHVVMQDGASVRIGRRSPDIRLWAVKKSTWEVFAKARLTGDEGADAAALATFLVAPNAVACSDHPRPVGTISADDPRDVIDHPLVAGVISDTVCTLERPASPAGSSGGTRASGSSCGSCAGGAIGGIAWLGALLVLLARQRRRARDHA